MAKRSNRSRARSQKRKASIARHTVEKYAKRASGGTSANVRTKASSSLVLTEKMQGKRNGAAFQSTKHGVQAVSRSRIPGAWSDRADTERMYDLRVWQRLASERKPLRLPKSLFNRMGQAIQSSMRGPESLFDDCANVEYRYGSTGPWHRNFTYNWTEEPGLVYVNTSRLLGQGRQFYDWNPDGCQRVGFRERITYHKPIGDLPPFRVPVKEPSVERMALDVMLADWRGRQQLAWLEALGAQA